MLNRETIRFREPYFALVNGVKNRISTIKKVVYLSCLLRCSLFLRLRRPLLHNTDYILHGEDAPRELKQ